MPATSEIRRHRSRLIGVVFCLTVTLVPTACHRRASAPDPFSGGLTEADGIQAVLTLRHPKLVNQDLEQFIRAVPEAAMLRVGLAGLSAYGFPEFSEIAAGSNIGVVMLRASAADWKAKSTVFIGLAKMKDEGKLRDLMGKRNFAFQKHGDWMFIAKDEGEFAKIKDPKAMIAYLERPQAVDVRVWIRASPELLAHFQERYTSGLSSTLAVYPPDKRKAALAYGNALFDLLKQLHSIEGTLAFTNDGIHLAYSAQFLPETPIGRFLRYQPGPPPGVARLVSGKALGTAVFRGDPKAARALFDSVWDSLIAVDYPPMAGPLTKWKTAYDAFAALNDGGGAAVFDFTVADQGGIHLKPRFFYVISGRFDPETARTYFKSTQSISHYLSKGALRNIRLTAGVPLPESRFEYSEHAITVYGVPFDRLMISNKISGQASSEITEYLGIVDGNFVVADGEDTLKERLPALRAKIELPDGIRFPDSPDILGQLSINGAGLVDILAAAGKFDLKDTDTRAQIEGLEASFSAAGPVSLIMTGAQAKATAMISVPYKFIEAAIQFVVYGKARSIDLFKLMAPSAGAGSPSPGLRMNASPARGDAQRRFRRGQELAALGQSSEALGEYLWCFDQGMKGDPAMVGVRRSYVLTGIVQLGQSYPPALQALRDRRAQAAEQIESHPRDFNALADLVAIDRALKENAQSLAFYDHLPAGSPSRALMKRILYVQFIEAKRYAEALQAMPYARYSAGMNLYRQMNPSGSGRRAFANALPTLLAMRAGSEAEALAGVGDTARARQIVGEILKTDHSAKTISILREHLARAGHGELVDLELKNQTDSKP